MEGFRGQRLDSLRSHSRPSQPSAHTHWKKLTPSTQVPPFRQGKAAQSFTSEREREEGEEAREEEEVAHTHIHTLPTLTLFNIG